MKFIYQLMLASYLSAGVAFSAQAEEKMSQQQLADYFVVIECVTTYYYEGGYEPDDTNRISLMNAMLAHYNLPSYDEDIINSLWENKPELDEKTLDIYSKCIIDEDEMLRKTAAKYGVEEPDS